MVCDNHFHSSSSQQDFQQLVQQYKFTIEAIFDDQEARALFRTFLKKDLNEEPFLFYEAVEKYNKTRLDKNRLELASEIIDKFMVVGAQHELNLSTSLRNDILKSWKQIYENNKDVKDSDLISCPKDLFTKAQDVIFIELKQDNFPRFVNSETFKKHVQKEHKKDSSILDKLGKKKNMNRSSSDVSTSFDDNHSVSSSSLVSTPSSESRQSMDASSESDSLDEKIENHVITLDNIDIALGLKRSSSTSSVSSLSLSNIHSGYVPPKEGELIPLLDELSPYVTPKDHQLALNLYDSFLNYPNEWTTLDDKVGMRTASSKPVYSFNPQKNPSESRPRFMLAISGIVPGTPKEWINLMYTEKVKTKICKRFSERFQVEYKSIDEQQGIHYPNSIIYMEFPLPFPITNRDFVVAKTIIPDKYDPATGEYGRYIMIQKPSYHHEFAPSKSRIRANHTVIYIVEKKGNASVRYTCLETGDMLGNIPAKLTAQLYRSTAKVMHNKVRKVCSSAYESHVLKQTTVHDHDGGLATLAEYQDYYKM